MSEKKDPAAVSLGRKGGKAGRGDAKRRSAEHYRKMIDAREKKADEKPPEPPPPPTEKTPC
ncbi:MAG: hypothetical protein PHS14_04805 [Elusimicrobia bacterium]|nr:hypothetical protein [Elusimicrobiota bacterium]